MRTIRWLPLILAAALAGALLTGASASASRARTAKQTLTFYFKATSTTFSNSAGKKVSNPAAGGHVYATIDAYVGNAKHHAAAWTGSAFEYCGITKVVSMTNVQATCDYALAVGGSIVEGIHNENIAAVSNTYPVSAGTGKWAHVRHGSVKTKAVDKKGDANAVVTIG